MLGTTCGNTKQISTYLDPWKCNMRNKGHKRNSTLPAKRCLSINMHKSILQWGGLQPHTSCPSVGPGVALSGGTASWVTCCTLTPAATAAGRKLPPSQSPDANQSINNTETTLVAPPLTTWLGTGTGPSSANATHQCPGVESSFVHFCKNNPQPRKKPKQTNNKNNTTLCLLFYWLALSVARKTLCCSWALSISFFFFLFFLSFAFGALFPTTGGRERNEDMSEKALSLGKKTQNIKSFIQSPSGKHHLWKKQPQRENCSH